MTNSTILEYSVDNGETWQSIGSTYNFSWKPPHGEGCNKVLVRITMKDNDRCESRIFTLASREDYQSVDESVLYSS